MKRLTIYLSLLLLLTCAKEDSQDPGTTPDNITPRYTLTASTGEGGSVSPTTGSFNAGTQVSVTATPSAGYTFSGWSNGSNANPVTVTLNSNTSITANFALIPVYSISVSAEEGGSVSSEGGEYQQGTQVTLTATPDEGYEFSGWSDGSTEATRVITANEDLTLTATFTELEYSYQLTVTSTEGGSVNSEGGEYNEGTEVTLTATASDGYRFIGWSDGSTEESVTITLSEDISIEAIFELIPVYTVTVTSTEGGSISSEGGDYQEGEELTITATPDEGYRFIGWSDSSTEESITITLSEDTSIEAIFELIPVYTVTVTSTEGGSISSEGGDYQEGTEITITATQDEGFRFTGWSDGSTEESITITLSEDISIEAIFEKEIIYFENRSPIYPGINNTSGNVKSNYYHPGIILTPDIILNNIDIREDCTNFNWFCNETFNLLNNTSRYLDYNKDGLIDLFGVLQNNSNGYSVGYGKYVLVDDVFNDPKANYFDSDIWFGGRMEINDFNSDGIDDILVWNSNDHDDLEGGFYTDRSPLEIVYISNDGNINVQKIGDPTSTHNVTSFDIDNDGDIDLVNIEWWNDDPGNTSQVPLFYINDGLGNFTVTNERFENKSFYLDSGFDYTFTAANSFDLDNDGYMDLLIGGQTKDESRYCVYDNPNDQFEQNCYLSNHLEGIRIMWGSESASFSEENSTLIPIDYYDNGNEKLMYSFAFIDIDYDGFFEMVTTGTNIPVDSSYGPNSGGFIEIYKNNGDRSFNNITDSRIENDQWDYANKRYISTGDIPLFYDLAIVDIDNDGDFDIMPHTINTGFFVEYEYGNQNNGYVDFFKWQNNIGPNFHWKNENGFFTLIDNREGFDRPFSLRGIEYGQ
jgi:hypothetical protein